jgi:hypothetical protein
MKEYNAMESKGVWEVVLISSMPDGRKLLVLDGFIQRKTKETLGQKLWNKVSVKYQARPTHIVMYQL